MGMTATEKILARAAGRDHVAPGEVLYPRPDLVTCHDGYVLSFMKDLEEVGLDRLHDPARVVLGIDHEVPVGSAAIAERLRQIRRLARELEVGHFYDSGTGQLHIVPMERGLVRPGDFVLAYDVHVTNYGAVGALGVAVAYEISAVLAVGTVWIQVPRTLRVNLHGRFGLGVTARDLAAAIIKDLGDERADYRVLELGGPAFEHIGLDGRIALCNLPIEIGAKSALVEPDAWTEQYVTARSDAPYTPVVSDPDANFEATYDYDLASVEPLIAAPPSPDNLHPVSTFAGVAVDQAYIGSCATAYDDLRQAAEVLRGRQIHPRVRLVVVPSTREAYQRATAEGLTQTLLDAGAMFLPPGCGPCAGGRGAPLADGEVSICTATRNDPGRMGSHAAQIYLGSAATVAASAVAGAITDPRALL